MADPRPVFGFPQEALDRGRVAGEAGAQDFDGRLAAIAVVGAVHRSRAALADILGEAVPGHRPTDHIVRVHGTAKLVNLSPRSKLDA